MENRVNDQTHRTHNVYKIGVRSMFSAYINELENPLCPLMVNIDNKTEREIKKIRRNNKRNC